MRKKPQSFPLIRVSRGGGFTLLETLITLVIVSALAGIAVVNYQKAVRRSESAEAIHAMQAIRTSEQAYHAQHQRYTEAESTQAINSLLGLDLKENLFTYEITGASDTDFVVIARRIGTNLADFFGQMMLTMNSSGAIAYIESPAAVSPAVAGSNAGDSSGGLSIGGNSGGGSSGAGSSSASSSDGGAGRGGSSATTSSFSIGGTSVAVPASLDFILRTNNLFTDWTNVNSLNIQNGTTAQVDLLTNAFNLINAMDAYSQVTGDLYANGISRYFSDPSVFAVNGICPGAIACHVQGSEIFYNPPAEPFFHPVILFNPTYETEAPGILASVIVHEGTHFQQYLDGDLMDPALDVVDTEFRAFWNAAAFWQDVREGFLPIDTPLEQANESWYQNAVAGEAALRAAIAQVYP